MTDTLGTEEIEAALTALTGWEAEANRIVKAFTFADFEGAIAFVDDVASAAEDQNHHPDIDIRYKQVILSLSTHDADGVTEQDIELATAIEELNTE